MQIVDLFSVPVLYTELTGSEKITRKEYDVLYNIEMQKREEDFQHSTFLSKSVQILEDRRLSNIKNTKMKYINYYLQNMVGVTNKFKMTTSWLTLNEKGSSHERHSHGNVILSCTMYFCENLDDKDMAPFYISQKGLEHVFQSFQFQYDINNHNNYNSKSLTLPVKNNTLVIFPGWLLHGSNPHKSEYKRYCIGSNYFIEDTVGTGYHSLDVKVEVKDKLL